MVGVDVLVDSGNELTRWLTRVSCGVSVVCTESSDIDRGYPSPGPVMMAPSGSEEVYSSLTKLLMIIVKNPMAWKKVVREWEKVGGRRGEGSLLYAAPWAVTNKSGSTLIPMQSQPPFSDMLSDITLLPI